MGYLKPDDQRLLFVPLGGSGEIGLNMNLYGMAGKWIMVDCGMSFGDDELPGVELSFPDPSFITDERDNLVAMVITHGHEDHIGAIPHLWAELECPIYATPFTAELIKDKLSEAGLLNDVELHVVSPQDRLQLGPFAVQYIPLAHSIAEGHGLTIEAGDMRIFHTGDWKLDNRPLIGPPSPSAALTNFGDGGVDCVVGDSTNVFNATESGSEAAVRENLLELIKGMTGRVVVTTFASNVARLETVAEIAKRTGRDLVLIGRSMHRILKAGQATGYLQDLPILVPEEHANDLPKDRVLILCTGCQGEPRAALSRMATGSHRHVNLAATDNVIFSSKIIPGNEKTLGRLFNDLTLAGINVVTEKDAFIHVSGHPGRAELATMYGWLRPHAVLPVHGEPRHLKRHVAFAHEIGIKSSLAPANGDVIHISKSGLKKVDEVLHGRLVLDGDLIIDDDDSAISDRRRLMNQGIASMSLLLDGRGALVYEPEIVFVGIPGVDAENLIEECAYSVGAALDRMKPNTRQVDGLVEEAARIAVRRTCRRIIGKNPGVITHILRQ